jgi:phosphatidylglycerophosphate synthase
MNWKLKKKYINYLNPREKFGEGKHKNINMYRRLALPLSEFLAENTKISPRQITLAGLLLTFFSVFFLVKSLFLLGGICWLISKFLDYLDGSLARVRNYKNRVDHDEMYMFGKWFDMIADQANTYLPFFGLGIGISLQQSLFYKQILNYLGISHLNLMLIWICVLFCIFNLFMIFKLTNTFNRDYIKKEDILFRSIKRKTSFIKKIKSVILPDLFLITPLFFLVGFLFNQPIFFMFLFALWTTFYLLIILVYYTKKMWDLNGKF